MLSTAEQRVLRTFRRFLMTPGQMLCFYGANLKQNKQALQQLTDKDFLVKEQFKGAYSLTREGFVAMNDCD
jgi:predicted transcriptional regulator